MMSFPWWFWKVMVGLLWETFRLRRWDLVPSSSRSLLRFWVVTRHNPSFVWCSISSSQILLKEGYRWKIGDGTCISVWNSSWLRNIKESWITTAQVLNGDNLMVRDLIGMDSRRWNEHKIRGMFMIRLNLNLNKHDSLIWRFDKRGVYTIKSGYKVCVERLVDKENLKSPGDWSTIWKIHVPPKVSVFLWHLLQWCLPTWVFLHERGVDCSSICVCCNEGLEDSWHLFLTPFQYWLLVKGKALTCNARSSSHSRQFWGLFFFFRTCIILDKEQLASPCIYGVCGGKETRNSGIILRRILSMCLLGLKRCYILGGMHVNMTYMQVNQQRRLLLCQPPPLGYLKCNVDAATFNNTNRVGAGACMQRSRWVCPSLHGLVSLEFVSIRSGGLGSSLNT